MLDLEELGIATADLMDTLEESELPAEARLEEIMVIAAVAWPVKGDDGGEKTGYTVYYRSSSQYPWVQRGLLEMAHKAVEKSSTPIGEEDE